MKEDDIDDALEEILEKMEEEVDLILRHGVHDPDEVDDDVVAFLTTSDVLRPGKPPAGSIVNKIYSVVVTEH